jgi:signal-transduction protein with cAMP-binding, CBS, and nucleotidyltransferase domain
METRISTILNHKGRKIVTVRPDQTIASFAYALHAHSIGATPVVDDQGDVIGMISERDIARGMVQYGGAVVEQPVSSLMTRLVSHCSAQDTVIDVMQMMTSQRIRHVPVYESGRLSGMVSIGDVVKQLLEEAQHDVESLKHYIMSA